jgi:hypothetical protein
MKTMTPGHVLTLLLCAAIMPAAAAQHEELQRPSFHASQSMTVRATVEAIDHQTREVTLRMPEGDTVSFVASEDARNLGQVAVGDVVNAEYVESLSIEVVANEGFEPESGEMQAMARTKEGEMPGVAAIDTQVATATVEEINIEANTFKLRGPDGSVQEYVARNPGNLKRAKVGDLVIFTVSTSVSIVVEQGPSR